MPHHTFWWEGIDGTRVFHPLPARRHLHREISADELHRAERHYAEKGRAGTSLLPFGWGDGGGGPTREMMAATERTRDLEGSPGRVEVGTPRHFFETGAEAEYPMHPPGRARCTSSCTAGCSRRNSGRSRQPPQRALLRQAELWAATATLRTGPRTARRAGGRVARPAAAVSSTTSCPGSAIAWVHREAERRHAAMTESLERLIADALAALADGSGVTAVVNASPFARAGVPALGAAPASVGAAAVRVAERADGGVDLDNGSSF